MERIFHETHQKPKSIGLSISLLVFQLIFMSLATYADSRPVEVAFLIAYDHYGNPIRSERGGRFSHVAISYRGQWLHAHPKTGVELTDNLHEYGSVEEVLTHPDWKEPNIAQVLRWLGKPFDLDLDWFNPDSTYCSKLVGQLLGLHPHNMKFTGDIRWGYSHLVGKKGMSPDYIHRELKRRGFVRQNIQCSQLLQIALQDSP